VHTSQAHQPKAAHHPKRAAHHDLDSEVSYIAPLTHNQKPKETHERSSHYSLRKPSETKRSQKPLTEAQRQSLKKLAQEVVDESVSHQTSHP